MDGDNGRPSAIRRPEASGNVRTARDVGGVGAVFIVVAGLAFAAPLVDETMPFASLVGGSSGAIGWGIAVLAVVVAFAGADVAMVARIQRSLSHGPACDVRRTRRQVLQRRNGALWVGVFGLGATCVGLFLVIAAVVAFLAQAN